MSDHVFSVGELNNYAKRVLMADPMLSDITVAGEISGFKLHYASGHLYFQLKDPSANVSCVMFKANAAKLNFQPADGKKVTVRGYVTIYQRDGRFQLYVESMSQQGIGDLYQKFEELKKKLSEEGLFSDLHKQNLPFYPKTIGIVTSSAGAALRDMVRIARRRNPSINIILSPCAVQGVNAASEIAQAIRRLNDDGRADVILCGRGGGSMEDLWCFNEEIVARAIFESKIPIVSCVGHETDFTIADFVADRRASTPSMGSEICVPMAEDLYNTLDERINRVAYALKHGNSMRRAQLQLVSSSRIFKQPKEMLIDQRRENAGHVFEKCVDNMVEILDSKHTQLDKIMSELNALDPKSVLERGYAYVTRGKKFVAKANDIDPKDKLSIRFYDGKVDATVNNIQLEVNENA